jgi:predicted nucleic acid-binding protein
VEDARLGIIFDTSLIIAGERRGMSVPAMIANLESIYGNGEGSISAISVVELTHGLYRAKTPFHFSRRQEFLGDLFQSFPIVPVTREIAYIAGKIHGEQMSDGTSIDLADILIGSTAISLECSLATLNQKHFARIPGLTLVAPAGI